MHAVQFGRWFSERRRTCGWSSQHLLAEAAQQHPRLCQAGISEDFLARLEAGHLVHPFRGMVRRRILLLAWLLCKTPRDLKTYAKAAGLSDCGENEKTQFQLLSEHLSTRQTPPPLLLPARPGHLKGREEEIEQITRTLSSPTTHILALTGMPGVGKSALAYEILHRLATAESEHLRRFPDGIAIFTCTDRQGTRGLISLLNEIIELFAPAAHTTQSKPLKSRTYTYAQRDANELPCESNEVEPELASIMDRARATLANKRVLLLLDDLNAALPLRQAVDVLLAQGSHMLDETRAEHGQRVILTTSQFVPSPTLIPACLPVQPLAEEAALALLGELVSKELSERELVSARQACAAVGYLPVAIEGMVTAILANGIPLTLMATHLIAHPLDSEKEVIVRMKKALARLEPEMRAGYLLLAALELSNFDLETATAVLTPQPLPLAAQEATRQTPQYQSEMVSVEGAANKTALLISLNTRATSEQLARLARTAAMLGQCVRLSLLKIVPGASGNNVHYHIHPLLYHYARTMTSTLPTESLALARHNLRARTLLL